MSLKEKIALTRGVSRVNAILANHLLYGIRSVSDVLRGQPHFSTVLRQHFHQICQLGLRFSHCAVGCQSLAALSVCGHILAVGGSGCKHLVDLLVHSGIGTITVAAMGNGYTCLFCNMNATILRSAESLIGRISLMTPGSIHWSRPSFTTGN